MEDFDQLSLEDLRVERCPRCLQPVPPKASRCPQCRQPIHAVRLLPWVLGAVGLLVLLFGLLITFRTMRNEPRVSVPVDESAAPQDSLSSEPPGANNAPSEPAKPEKRPPLNER